MLFSPLSEYQCVENNAQTVLKNIADWYLIFMTTTVFIKKKGGILSCHGTYEGDKKFVQLKKKKNLMFECCTN